MTNDFRKFTLYTNGVTIATNNTTNTPRDLAENDLIKDSILYRDDRIAELEKQAKKYREGLQFVLGVLVGVDADCDYCDHEIESAPCTCYRFEPEELRLTLKKMIEQILENTKNNT
jgi:predicted metal-binding protein